ncbi:MULTISPECIES: hypothetical protein [Rhizobium/Agrobacterium group]|uniref:Transposase n=2 Tax=Rhizobium/Agrobacterium group TaxID=227290 RepID=B9K3R2_ALLAM|nr:MULTISPECIES: hypothetical protein [Rhizobium/Agrobacterium group]ACM39510.1 transposase [Allorhizobium ampelinum S4]MCF1448972.1 transposase [Allorhizobium ampelinum]MUO31308.1 transposase [Agrobacterium vitis]MUO44991.1 transposase [Agrobacterium vitis]MUP13014.1 transposase [Agrobacterium vitis]
MTDIEGADRRKAARLPFGDYVEPDALVRAVDAFVDTRRVAAATGQSAHHPGEMIRLHVGVSRSIQSFGEGLPSRFRGTVADAAHTRLPDNCGFQA